jgi:hypothetical protein
MLEILFLQYIKRSNLDMLIVSNASHNWRVPFQTSAALADGYVVDVELADVTTVNINLLPTQGGARQQKGFQAAHGPIGKNCDQFFSAV